MHIHRPIDTAGLKIEDAEQLKDDVYRILEDQLVAFGVDISKK
jgi:hypothetical protein